MFRSISAPALALILLATATANAGDGSMHYGGGDWWHNYWVGWHRNNCWMEPFIYPDRASVANTFQAEICKGWQLQCLLGDPHYFEPDNNSLSAAGLIKLNTILTQNPPQYRTVYVERSLNDEITSRRVAATQRALADLVRGGPIPEVYVSAIPLIGAPAEQVNGANALLTKYIQGMPVPTPRAFQNNNDSGSGGSSGQ